jgi:hypothetical protein
MKTTKITIGRLFNLGNFEHIRYEIAVELNHDDSAASAIIGLERILEALKPESKCCVKSSDELDREARKLADYRLELESKGDEEFRKRHGWFEGTSAEYLTRCCEAHKEEVGKRVAYMARADKARQLLDDLGGAAVWKGCKLDWERDDEDQL